MSERVSKRVCLLPINFPPGLPPRILNRRDPESAYLPNSFALTVCLEIIRWRKFRIDNRKSLYFNHGIQVDEA